MKGLVIMMRKRLALCLFYHLVGAVLFTACFLIMVTFIVIFNGWPQGDPLGIRTTLTVLLFLPLSFLVLLPFLPITYRMGDLTEDGR